MQECDCDCDCDCGADAVFEVFGKAAAVEPGERARDDPSTGQHDKALCGTGALGDLPLRPRQKSFGID